MRDVAVQLSVEELYLPPVLVRGWPPHTTISAPVQTAVWLDLAEGTFAPVEVGLQVSDDGSYRPPVFSHTKLKPSYPPQTIISVPVQTAVGPVLGVGPPVVESDCQLSV